jgi:hypothetical protein
MSGLRRSFCRAYHLKSQPRLIGNSLRACNSDNLCVQMNAVLSFVGTIVRSRRRETLRRRGSEDMRTLSFCLTLASLVLSCSRNTPIEDLRAENIRCIVVGDCSGVKYRIEDPELVKMFLSSIVVARTVSAGSARLSKGVGRVWINMNDASAPVFLKVYSTISNGPVVYYSGESLGCPECEAFYMKVKMSYPEFNWCKSPQLD